MAEAAGASIKKRKRTGKAREEAKRAAIAARDNVEADSGPADGPPEETATEPEGTNELVQNQHDLDSLSERLPRALKALRPIFKQGRTFEVQRIVKKVKFLRSKDADKDEVASLETQLTLLSHLHLDRTIAAHLHVKLQKHPRFKHSTLPNTIASQLDFDSSAAAMTSSQSEVLGKVENRLCSNKTVSEGVKSVMAWVMGESGAKLPPIGTKQKRTPEVAASSSKGPKSKAQPRGNDEFQDGSRIQRVSGAYGDEELDPADESDADARGWESGSISDAMPSSRPLSVASKDDSFLEEEDDSDDDDLAVPTNIKRATPKATEKPPAKTQKLSKTPITSSTFLPSLSTGFVLGDSDSDPDLDPDVDGSGLVGNKAVRKNRRGQRARQAIWEQKYGKHAKHVVARQAAEEDAQRAVQARANRGRGRGAAMGARWNEGRNSTSAPELPTPVLRPPSSIRGGYSRGMTGQSGPDRGANTGPPRSKPGATMHPSWQAAKLRQKKELGAVKPQGTKIVFE